MKTNPGRFFEDYTLGQVIRHAVPRSVSGGERALYHALYPARHALYSSNEFARASRPARQPDRRSGGVPHRVRQIGARHLAQRRRQSGLCRGALAAPGLSRRHAARQSEVIGLKQNSSGKTGVVYVRTTGLNQHDLPVMEFVRWVMVRKHDPDAPAPDPVVPRDRPGGRPRRSGDPRRASISPITISTSPAIRTASAITRSANRSTTSMA